MLERKRAKAARVYAKDLHSLEPLSVLPASAHPDGGGSSSGGGGSGSAHTPLVAPLLTRAAEAAEHARPIEPAPMHAPLSPEAEGQPEQRPACLIN